MQCHAILKTGDIVVARLSGVIRIVQSDAQVQTEDQKIHVIAQADACSQSYLFGKVFPS